MIIYFKAYKIELIKIYIRKPIQKLVLTLKKKENFKRKSGSQVSHTLASLQRRTLSVYVCREKYITSILLVG
jgi:hypothetical protein